MLGAARWIYLTTARGVDGQRIVIIMVVSRRRLHRNLDCPPGAKPPQPTPTVQPGDVQPARERTRPRKPRRPRSE